ncbi:PIN domain-containing protein [Methylosinus sp. R-45379]|uniref:PIN domain-containing protein n=1 Tax=Methylosinus sp. R-45379 TaxID=980563 RepID=UPI000AE44426|nr:PIN domain-containing protein [Methylosinus sp. R-45379]
MTKPVRNPTEPLRTRHVFLDTEVYRRAGFNISNTPFALLAKQIEEGRVALHVTDITLAETHRQLKEAALVMAAEAKRLARDFNRIAQLTGEGNVTVKDVDGSDLGEKAWTGFIDALIKRFRSHSVLALEIPARGVFDRYFAGTPPFDHRGSKEFPDAFVVEALARYCKSNEISMYVVSGDTALRKAVGEHATLLALETIEDILAAATAEGGGDFEAIADEIFAAPGFDDQLTEAIAADLDFLDFAYCGSLSDVSVLGAQLDEIVSVDGYDVAAFDDTKIGLILQANTVLAVRLHFVDETELRDKDDDIIPTEVETTIRTLVRLKIYVSIDLRTLRFMETELLTRDVIVE